MPRPDKKGGDKKGQKDDAGRGLDAARAGLTSVASHVSSAVTEALLALMEHHTDPGPEWVEAEGKIRSALDGVLPAAMAGKTSNGLIHICDWSATFLELAGLPPDAGEPHAVAPSDSISAWPWLSGRAATSGRAELVYDHNMFELAQGAAKPCLVLNYSGEARCARGALQRDGWKLVVGPEAQASWFGWFSPNASNPVNRTSPSVTAQACFPNAPCLFNLNDSMTEHDDVSAAHPAVVTALLRRFRELAGQYHPPRKDPPLDLGGLLAAVDANGGFVGPWMREPVEAWPS